MFGTTHGLAGLILAQRTRSPGTAFLAGIISHFLLDAVPHYQGEKEHAVADGAIGGPALLYYSATLNAPAKNVAGVAGALMPDVVALMQHEDSTLHKIKRLVHPTAKNNFLLAPEFLLASAALMYIRRQSNGNVKDRKAA